MSRRDSACALPKQDLKTDCFNAEDGCGGAQGGRAVVDGGQASQLTTPIEVITQGPSNPPS